LPKIGIRPREIYGLLGIITAPFFHSTHNIDGAIDASHILNNSIPLLLLGTVLFMHFKDLSYQIFIWLFIGTGLWLWSFGRPANHIGASGIVYALFGFISVSGFLRKNKNLLSLSMLTVFLYGSMIWGIFPSDPSISWEGHLSGLAIGIVLAVYFRKRGPRNTITYISDENFTNEALYGNDYWKTEQQILNEQEEKVSTSANNPIKFRYHYVEKGIKKREDKN